MFSVTTEKCLLELCEKRRFETLQTFGFYQKCLRHTFIDLTPWHRVDLAVFPWMYYCRNNTNVQVLLMC